MNKVETTLRRWAFWLLPFVLLGLLIAWQTDWGRAWSRVPPAAASVVPPPVTVAVLPAYVTDATTETSRDTIDRTLFNPTRRPAPVAVVEAAKPRMQRGQFALTGTLLTDGKSTAFLRDVNGGKSRRVMQGETVNGMLVAEVRANGVRLTLGDETEELGLKLAVGPRTTIQPVVIRPTPEAAMAAAGLSPADAARIAPQVRDVADVLAERRRMARDAEAAAAGRAPGTPLVAPTAAGATPTPAVPAATGAAANDPAWASVYQRYQQPRR